MARARDPIGNKPAYPNLIQRAQGPIGPHPKPHMEMSWEGPRPRGARRGLGPPGAPQILTRALRALVAYTSENLTRAPLALVP